MFAAATAGRDCAPGATGSAVRRGAATGAAESARSLPARLSRIHVTCAHSCFERARARRCGICGEVKPISRKARDGQPDICTACARRRLPLAVCTQCGERKPCLFPESASPICRRRPRADLLRPSPLRAVRRAPPGRLAQPDRSALWPVHEPASRLRALCARTAGSCVAPRPSIQETVLCAACACVEPHHVCELCGGEDEPVPDGICTRCRSTANRGHGR